LRVVEAPGLVSFWISNKDALLHVRSNASAPILLDMDIGKTAKDSDAASIRFLAIPVEIWSRMRAE
jgi:hypothetical protein